MHLVIAEKPSVAKAIASVLKATVKRNGYIEGNDYIVSWCYGHLMEMKQPDEYGIWAGNWSFEQLPMIPDKFQFKVKSDAKAQFDVLKKLLKDDKVSDVICATDADREGECIFRYVYSFCGCTKSVARLWVSSLESSAISKAFKTMKGSNAYNSLFSAGYSRARADWLVGMNFSRLFSVRYSSRLPVGRVQTPTLAMIVKRDYQVTHFVKEQYFTVDFDCGFLASSERIDNRETAEQLAAAVSEYGSAVVEDVKVENKTVNPPKLYDLTTLQREANKRYGYTANQTLKYLQSLYEAALTTYPRTDCQYLPDDMQQTAEEMVKAVYTVYPHLGKVPAAYSLDKCVNNDKVTGHHAIIPCDNIKTVDLRKLSEGEHQILYLVCTKLAFAASEPHKYEAVTAVLKCVDNVFTAKGKTVLNNGWKGLESRAFSADDDKKEKAEEDTPLPKIEQGQEFQILGAGVAEHWTSPPKPYTEDTLLSAMEHAGEENYDEDAEKKGLGTPATRAGIIEQLMAHKLAMRKGKQIFPTDTGKKLIAILPPEIKSAKLTANWEMKLQDIERGAYSAEQFMTEIKQYVIDTCARYCSVDDKVSFDEKSIGNCPNCGAEIKQGKFGYYCTGKCGMNIARVYNKELTEGQLSRLLAGQKVSFTVKGKKSTVFPQIEPFSYKNKEGKEISGFQWCCILDDVIDKFKDHADPKYNL